MFGVMASGESMLYLITYVKLNLEYLNLHLLYGSIPNFVLNFKFRII
jgi:hypothetical protein